MAGRKSKSGGKDKAFQKLPFGEQRNLGWAEGKDLAAPPNPRGLAHLQPLGTRVALSSPGIELSLLVQPRVEGIPAEGAQAPRLIDAGGCDLLVGDDVVLQAQRFGAACQQRGLSPRNGIHSFPGA